MVHVPKMYQVFMTTLPQQGNLPNGGAGYALTFMLQPNLLYGNKLAVAAITGLVYNPIGALPNAF